MAKGRVINKSISLSQKVNRGLRNPLDCLLYTWGLTHGDDEGRIDGDPVLFRGRVAPILPGLTDSRVGLALTAMEKAHLITRYTVKGVMVVQFLDWDIHQLFHGYKRKPSHLPPEPKDNKITHQGDNHQLPPLKYIKVKESNINKDKYSDFVRLSQNEFSKLLTDYGKTQTDELINRLNLWIGQVGEITFNKKYKSHYFTILNIARRDGVKKIDKPKHTPHTPAEPEPTPEEQAARIKRMNEAMKAAGIGRIGHPEIIQKLK